MYCQVCICAAPHSLLVLRCPAELAAAWQQVNIRKVTGCCLQGRRGFDRDGACYHCPRSPAATQSVGCIQAALFVGYLFKPRAGGAGDGLRVVHCLADRDVCLSDRLSHFMHFLQLAVDFIAADIFACSSCRFLGVWCVWERERLSVSAWSNCVLWCSAFGRDLETNGPFPVLLGKIYSHHA